jgi:hypothetical protein
MTKEELAAIKAALEVTTPAMQAYAAYRAGAGIRVCAKLMKWTQARFRLKLQKWKEDGPPESAIPYPEAIAIIRRLLAHIEQSEGPGTSLEPVSLAASG